MNRRGFEMSFAWLFGIVIGIIILAFAIYGVTKLMSGEDSLQDARTSKEIGILLNPLETGFESSKTSSFTMPVDTKLYATCDNMTGDFGRQLISVSQKKFNKWSQTDLQVSFPNKYIFAEEGIKGKKFYVFSKPFEFPFKVSDVIYITSEETNYCFSESPQDIERELENLNQANIFTKEEDFPEECILVCFSGGCDIEVHYEDEGGFVKKEGGSKSFFEGDALMFAAIFSSYENYVCGIDRLMMRAKVLTEIYEKKAAIVAVSNCHSDLDLIEFAFALEHFEDSLDLSGLSSTAKELEDANSGCKLW